jgi:sporulation protein YlmC with PRC-barrel domain
VTLLKFDVVTRTADRCTGRVVGIRMNVESGMIAALVIRPDSKHQSDYLVPKKLVSALSPFVHLNCMSSDLERCGEAAVAEVMPAPIGCMSYPSWEPIKQVHEDLKNPFGRVAVGRTRVILPPSEAELLANQCVFATDGVVGRMRGVVMSENLGRVSELLLDRARRPRRLPMFVPVNLLTDWRSMELSITGAELQALIDQKSSIAPPVDQTLPGRI